MSITYFLGSGLRERQAKACPTLIIDRGLDVSSAVPVQPGAWYGLRENDADGHEDRACARSERDRYFHARTFAVLIPAAETETAFRQVFANHDFFRKAAFADTCQNARLHARAVAPRNNTFLRVRMSRDVLCCRSFRERFHPNGW